MKTTKVPRSRCPYCRTKLDAMTSLTGEVPAPEISVSVCLECGNVLFADAQMMQRKPTARELADVYQSPEGEQLRHTVAMVRKFRQFRKSREN